MVKVAGDVRQVVVKGLEIIEKKKVCGAFSLSNQKKKYFICGFLLTEVY